MDSTPQIHGHRGARGLFPENSIPAIEAGIKAGCHAIEVDVCVTRDNQVVLQHDLELSADLVRDKDGNWITDSPGVRNLTLSQLQEFNFGKIRPGTGYANRFAGQSSVDNLGISTLSELFAYFDHCGFTGILNLEMKGAPYQPDLIPEIDQYADLVTAQINASDMAHRIFLQSFDWRLPLAVRERLPQIKIGFTSDLQSDGDPQAPLAAQPVLWNLNRDIADYPDLPSMVKDLGADVWSTNYLDLTPRLYESARKLGLEVCVWTVNDRSDMGRMIEMGVDAITTDYPNILAQLVDGYPSNH